MEKIDIEREIERKKNAIEFFGDFFTSGYNLQVFPFVYNERVLDQCLDYYKDQDFFKNSKITKKDASREERIIDGYNYIKEKLNGIMGYDLEDNLSIALFEQYYNLMDEIGTYRFVPHFRNSISDTQNKATDDMLMNLALLEPVVKESLKDIDTFMTEEEDKEVVNKVKEALIKVSKVNEDKISNLQSCENEYHDTWEGACRGSEYTYSELGEARRLFRKEKNQSARRVLDFSKELLDLDKYIMEYKSEKLREDVDNNREVFSLICHSNNLVTGYENVVDRIAKGPNYYCFLTKEEIEEHTKENKEHKKVLKNH